jgi:ABC-type multidrug transport system ATPase subunit
MLLGMLPPTSGASTVFGLDSQRDSCAIKRRVGYVAEGMKIYGWMRIREALWFTSRFYPSWSDDKAKALLDRFQLDPKAKIGTLSRGMHAQVCLVLALAHDPELLVLDEATGGLDVIIRRQFLEHIATLASEQGKTILIASHLIHDVERVADWIAFIDQGGLIWVGKQDALKQSYRQIRLTFEENVPSSFVVPPSGGSGQQGRPDESGTTSVIPGTKSTIPGLVRAKVSGREVLLTVKDFSSATEAACREFRPSNVEILDMSLEDIFEAIAGNGGPL